MLLGAEILENGVYKNNSGKIEKNGINTKISIYEMFSSNKSLEIIIKDNIVISCKRFSGNKEKDINISKKQIKKYISEITTQKSKVS